MSASAKACPICASALRLYETPSKLSFSVYFAGELIFWLVALGIFALTWSLGEISYLIAGAVGVLVVVLVFRPYWQRSQRQAIVERGRYYCASCHHHFEGDALRQLTKLEPSH